MAIKYRQISLKDTFSNCLGTLMEDTPSFFQLLDEHFDIQEFIPSVFTNAFYQHLGRNRTYPLSGFLSALILQKIFSIPADSLLILFLSICKELRDFCGFSKVPDAPLLTRFRQNFEPYIELNNYLYVVLYGTVCNWSTPENLIIMFYCTIDTMGTQELFVLRQDKLINCYYNQAPNGTEFKNIKDTLTPLSPCSCNKYSRR